MMLTDLISTYQGVCPEAVCDSLTALFEDSSSFHVKREDEYKSFTELNLNEYHPEIVPLCVSYLKKALHMYKVKHPEFSKYIELKGLEEFRIKRYREKGECFEKHVDVGDYQSAKRQLSFLFYLNDDFKGGGTKFNDKFITPHKGDILVFPPMWMFPHEGMPVTGGTKYIMSSYLHYT